MAYEIPIRPDALDPLIERFVKLADSVKAANDAVKDLNGGVDQTGRKAVSSGGNASTTDDTGAATPIARRPTGPKSKVYDVPGGAFQRLDTAQRRLDQMKAAGVDPQSSVMKDAEDAVRRAQRAVDLSRQRADPKLDMLMTSRFDPTNGKLYPLVNRALAAGMNVPSGAQTAMQDAGMSAATAAKYAPLVAKVVGMALPLMGGVAGAALVVAGMEGASKLANQARTVQGLTAGTRGEAGTLLGLVGANAGNLALSLADALRGSSYGAAYMRKRGIYDAGEWGTPDKAPNLIRAIDELTRIVSDQEAGRVARGLGLTDQLWLRDLRQSNPNAYEEVKKMRQWQTSQEGRRNSADWEYMKESISSEWDRLVGNFAGGTVKGLKNLTDRDFWLGNPFSKNWWQKHVLPPSDASASSAAGKLTIPSPYGENIGRLGGRDGDYQGGGERSRSAWPAGWKGAMIQNGMDAQAVNLGAYSL